RPSAKRLLDLAIPKPSPPSLLGSPSSGRCAVSVSSRRVLAGSPQSVRRVYILCGMTTGTLAVSVGGDGLLTALQLHGVQLCSVSIPPVLSWLFEISAVSILGLRVLILMKRARSTTRLFTP